MNNTWVKLYRKTNDKGLMKDHLAWILFSWLLINVDKETGKRKIGRYTVCDELGINPSTYYKVLKRLEEKWKVIRVSVAKTWSEVWIVNWGRYQYQLNEQGNEQVSSVETKENESNTIQEYKNTRIQEERGINYLLEIPEMDVEDFVKRFVVSKSQVISKGRGAYDSLVSRGKTKTYTDYKAFLRNILRTDFGERKIPVQTENYEIDEKGMARLVEVKSGMKMKGMN